MHNRPLQFYLLMLFFFIFLKSNADPGHELIGKWLTEDETAHIEIYKSGTAFFGVIAYGTGDENYDIKNPDKSKRSTPLIGLVILKDLKYDGDGLWTGGTVYDPNNGKTYSCLIKLTSKDTLKITGYIGFSWIGRSEIWRKIE